MRITISRRQRGGAVRLKLIIKNNVVGRGGLALPRKRHRQENAYAARRGRAGEDIFDRESHDDRRQRAGKRERGATSLRGDFFVEAGGRGNYKRKQKAQSENS